MLGTTCHCGAIKIEVPRPPHTLTNCDCSICRRYGTLWAYYKTTEVRVIARPGAASAYSWGRKTLRFVSVNARNFDPAAIGAVRIRLLDGALTERYLTRALAHGHGLFE